MRRIFLSIVVLLNFVGVKAQPDDFEITLEEAVLNGLSGIHSFAVAQNQSEWLWVGGRVNGLHGYLPPSSFPAYTQNEILTVVNLNTAQIWTSAIDLLPDSVAEHISSSNMEFYQEGDYLYFIGGYGWSAAANDFITFPKLTAIHVSGLIDAIKNGTNIAPFFRQITYPELAITGGQLGKLNETYYLIWGHTFTGRYNHINGPTFTQNYSYQIRKFEIEDDGNSLNITGYSAVTDSAHFRRRDYNISPMIFPDGTEGFTAFTGVFQPDKNLPYLNSVDIYASGYTVNNTFQQKLNQYHTARLPVWDSTSNAMHTVFFGGIGQYVPDSLNPNLWVEDTLVPFVKTVSRITRVSNASYETSLPIQMPGFIGANAEFIPIESTSLFTHSKIFRLDAIDTARTLVGFIVGGIVSPRENIFQGNESESSAYNKIIKVYIRKKGQLSDVSYFSKPDNFKAWPNPSKGKINLSFSLSAPAEISLYITNNEGRTVETLLSAAHKSGNIQLAWNTRPYPDGIYFCNLQINGIVQTFRLSVK